MPEPEPSLAERVDRLERGLAEVQRRLEAVERFLERRTEHPADRRVVQGKVTYDWQS